MTDPIVFDFIDNKVTGPTAPLQPVPSVPAQGTVADLPAHD